jgi:hypothetical protein
VETLAYAGDYLSYYQDAAATEAYLETARQRISIRRHVRLVDYMMHEGCNARAWVAVTISEDKDIPRAAVSFITGLNSALPAKTPVLTWDNLEGVPSSAYEVFEPMAKDNQLHFFASRNEIHFYTWGERECCLKKGATSATLRDPGLKLTAGDVLIFEEVISPTTGLTFDADPRKRWAVRLTKVTASQDPVYPGPDAKPTTLVEVEWGKQDALPFPLCISAIGPAPSCSYIDNLSVARGNVVLVDHGRTLPSEDLHSVTATSTQATCDCAGEPSEVQMIPAKFQPQLAKTPLTYSQPLPADAAASACMTQDPRKAIPQLTLTSTPAATWRARYDLIESTPLDWEFVVEIDSDGIAHLRFGDGELGAQPPAGMAFSAVYRIGNGIAGNVGAEAISRLVLRNLKLDGITITVRNPLPTSGGIDAETIANAQLLAPRAFRKVLKRAIVAQDYETLAEQNPKVQNASAELVWTGSWYEADVAIDPLGTETLSGALLKQIRWSLEDYRRMGHDLEVTPARYVPIDLELLVCVLPDYQRAHVVKALLDLFSNRRLPGGKLGFFHPDNLTFGEPICVSKIVAAAQAVVGVECVTVTALHRLFEAPNHELSDGELPLAVDEIAQLDNDPNFPEHGVLKITARGGR